MGRDYLRAVARSRPRAVRVVTQNAVPRGALLKSVPRFTDDDLPAARLAQT